MTVLTTRHNALQRVANFSLDTALRDACAGDLQNKCQHSLAEIDKDPSVKESALSCLQTYREELDSEQCKSEVCVVYVCFCVPFLMCSCLYVPANAGTSRYLISLLRLTYLYNSLRGTLCLLCCLRWSGEGYAVCLRSSVLTHLLVTRGSCMSNTSYQECNIFFFFVQPYLPANSYVS